MTVTPDQVRNLLSQITSQQAVPPMSTGTSPELTGFSTGQKQAILLNAGWSATDVGNMLPEAQDLLIKYGVGPGGSDKAQIIGSQGGGYYVVTPDANTPGGYSTQLLIPGTGTGGGTDNVLLEQLRAQEIAASQGEEARAQEMQPYDIAAKQASTAADISSTAYNTGNLARQTLQDQFTRAKDAFDSARLAEDLANEKKKTATTLLSNMVDALVPSTPSSISAPYPVVGTINWNALGTAALNPETDAALKYLMQFQQQNAGV